MQLKNITMRKNNGKKKIKNVKQVLKVICSFVPLSCSLNMKSDTMR